MYVSLLVVILTTLAIILFVKGELVSNEHQKLLLSDYEKEALEAAQKKAAENSQVRHTSIKGAPLPTPAEELDPIDPKSLLENENYIRALDRQIENALQVPAPGTVPVVYNDIYTYCEFCDRVSHKPDRFHNPGCPILMTI